MKIKFLGTHNSESRNTRLASFIIDKQLAVDAGSLTSELTFAEQKKIRWVLISHGHYDHIKTIPTLAFNNTEHVIRVYSSPATLDIISGLMNGVVYPDFTSVNSYLGKAAVDLVPVEPYSTLQIGSYRVTCVPVNHSLEAMGFEIGSPEGKRLFYTGDTGHNLGRVWEKISPQTLIIDVTFPNRLKRIAEDANHLCPEMLREELISFNRIKGYLPEVIAIHMNPQLEAETTAEIEEVSSMLGIPISIAHEGKEINL